MSAAGMPQKTKDPAGGGERGGDERHPNRGATRIEASGRGHQIIRESEERTVLAQSSSLPTKGARQRTARAYWLYVVTNCVPDRQTGATNPIMQEPIKDPARFPWQEVTKVAHYWLEVNAITRPMVLREADAPYRKRNQ
jgi:hypothetical protein